MPSPSTDTRSERGSTLRKYIDRFTATERVIFGVLSIGLIISAVSMSISVSDHFSTEIPTPGGELREGVIGLPRSINPVLAISDVDRDLSSLIFSGLMKYSHDTLVPDLAQSYTLSPDGRTYTFTLRPHLTFHDDTPLTTADIAFTIQKIQDPKLKSPRAADWKDVTVTVISPTVISFTLKEPYSPFITTTVLGIIPKHIWENQTDEQFIFSQYNSEPIGSGPYRIKTITRDSGDIPWQYVLSTWSSYYAQKPYIQTIYVDFLADEQTALAALDVGKIDSLSSISPEAAAALERTSPQSYQILTSPLPRIFGVFFNQTNAPVLADATVRKALDMSVDRDEIINDILMGYGVALYGPTLSKNTTPAIPTGSTTTYSHKKIDAAQFYLEKNGWKKGTDGIYTKKVDPKSPALVLSFTIYTANTPDLVKIAEHVKNTWNAIGAAVTVKVYEPSDLYQNVIRTRNYDALLFGEAIGKDRDLYAFWHSSQRNAPGLNIALYANSKTDVLLENIRSTNDETKRAAAYAQFNELIQTDIPAVFLYSPDFMYVTPKTVRGIRLDSISIPADRWNDIQDWYIKTEKVWNIFI